MHFLQIFTSSWVTRQKYRIEFSSDKSNDIEIMTPILQLLAEFTAFEVVIVEIMLDMDTLPHWYCMEHSQTRSLWKPRENKLKSTLGPAVYDRSINFGRTEVKPREYLVRKNLSI